MTMHNGRCKRGHDISGASLYFNLKTGHIFCRVCRRQWQLRAKHRAQFEKAISGARA